VTDDVAVQAAEIARRTASEQGHPPTVDDAVILGRVAVLVDSAPPASVRTPAA
jgi:hypothetical protein